MNTMYLIAILAVAGLVTVLLRAVPFALLAPIRKSRLIKWLDRRMAVGIMAILSVYTMMDVAWSDLQATVPTLVVLVVTVRLHLWKHNLMTSILSGTVVCIALSAVVG